MQASTDTHKKFEATQQCTRQATRSSPAIDSVGVVVRHAVEQRDRLVGVDGDQHVSGVRVDVVVREPRVKQAKQRGLVEAVQLGRILERGQKKKTTHGRHHASGAYEQEL